MPYLDADAKMVVDTKEELFKEVENALSKGETEISFTTSELDQDDLNELNQYIEGFYGTVTEYKIQNVKLFGESHVTLTCEISDNYYVEEAILNGKEIPEDREKAQELKIACERFLEKMGSGKKSAYKKEKRAHDYIVSRVSYGYPDENTKADGDGYSAYGALVLGKAVCNGYAEAMKLLCDLSGVQCEMITGTAGGENHAWNLVKVGKDWYHVDATWDDPEPDVASRVMYTYFNVDDDQIRADHTWDSGLYRKAEGTRCNYYRKKDLICEDYDEFREKCEDLLESGSPKELQFLVKDYDKEAYSSEALQFILRYSGASSLHLQAAGTSPYQVLYFSLEYS